MYDTIAGTYLHRLKRLWLAGCTNLTTSGIEVLRCLPALKYVDLSGCTGIGSLDCLIENPGFGVDDSLKIHLDTWSEALKADVECLRYNEVSVDANCQDCSGSTCAGHESTCGGTCE